MRRMLMLAFATALYLELALPAAADDVVVELGADDAFVIQDSSSQERWRFEDSGQTATQGDLDLGGRIVVDPGTSAPRSVSKQPSLWLAKPGNAGGAGLILERGEDTKGQLACLGNVDSSDGFTDDLCGHVLLNNGDLSSFRSYTLDGGERWGLDPDGSIQLKLQSVERPGNWMLVVSSDVAGPSIYTRSSSAPNSSLQWFAGKRTTTDRPVVAVIDDDLVGDSGSEGFVLWFCDPNDLTAAGARFDWTASSNNLAASSGAPFAGVSPGTRLAIVNAATSMNSKSNDANFQEVISVQNGGADVTLSSVSYDAADTRLSVFSCTERMYRDTDGGIVIDGNRFTADPCGSKPAGFWFYNATSDFYCFCNGSGQGVQMHGPTASCF